MIVVSDTSPLNYLVLIELQNILPALFDRILIPEAVRRELQSPAAPELIRKWLATEPDLLEARRVSAIDSDLAHLGPGEREAIALALSLPAGLVLLDERRGRQASREHGLAVSGTLRVLDLAARRGLIGLSDALKRLEQTTFRVTPHLLRRIRERHS